MAISTRGMTIFDHRRFNELVPAYGDREVRGLVSSHKPLHERFMRHIRELHWPPSFEGNSRSHGHNRVFRCLAQAVLADKVILDETWKIHWWEWAMVVGNPANPRGTEDGWIPSDRKRRSKYMMIKRKGGGRGSQRTRTTTAV